jgi:hypothetical protein
MATPSNPRTLPPNQLRRPRKPVRRTQCGHSRNKRREPQGEAPSAVWFGGWEVCFHGLGKGGFVHLFYGEDVVNLAVFAHAQFRTSERNRP